MSLSLSKIKVGYCKSICNHYLVHELAIIMRFNIKVSYQAMLSFLFISCQRAVLKELKLGPNIARNTALSENVFMMVVCIELRIPLFVVGKPGSSKSLAKTVVADNMQGDAARSELFKTFKEVMKPLL